MVTSGQIGTLQVIYEALDRARDCADQLVLTSGGQVHDIARRVRSDTEELRATIADYLDNIENTEPAR